jgi:DNA-binding transcriptional LysR family regulator
MQIEPRRLLVLRAVRRSGGVVAAARALHLTPSAVSQQLGRLEAETGMVLLDRSRRGGGRSAELTGAGHALAEHAERVAEVLADAERELTSLRGRVAGPVGVGGFATVLRRLVAPAIAELAVSDPAVEPQVVEVDEAAGLAALRAGRLDLLLVERNPDAPARPAAGLTEEALLTDPYRVVVPSSWPAPDDPDRVLRGPWVGATRGLPARAVLDRMCADAGLLPDVRHACTESSATLALVGGGLGAAIVPELALVYLPHPGVRRAAGGLEPGSRTLSVVHRRGRTEPSPATGLVLDAVRSQAADELAARD